MLGSLHCEDVSEEEKDAKSVVGRPDLQSLFCTCGSLVACIPSARLASVFKLDPAVAICVFQ
jgi:hypothetical protein